MAAQRGDVDNTSPAGAFDHGPADPLRQQKRYRKVQLQDRLPIIDRHIDSRGPAIDPRTIDQDIYPASPSQGLFDQLPAVGRPGQIGTNGQGPSTRRLDSLN
ncbi:unnamed protein product [marine sediment metagenome]|uniref:Uncharacterized protein n=1 Tax=marine sediment metagenome TaxID=412755 RepID=X1M8M9_9ZZZZ